MVHEITWRETAKLLRNELKKSFPETDFSVRGIGNCWLLVRWEDGAPYSAVAKITDRFAGAEYDMVDDSWHILYHECNGEPVHFNVNIQLQRDISDAAWLAAAQQVASQYGLPEPTIADRNGDWVMLHTSIGEPARVLVNRILNG